jgi:hypothetical protein
MKNAVLWDVAPCRYFVNRRFGGTCRLHLQGIRNPRAMNQNEQVAVFPGNIACYYKHSNNSLDVPFSVLTFSIFLSLFIFDFSKNLGGINVSPPHRSHECDLLRSGVSWLCFSPARGVNLMH